MLKNTASDILYRVQYAKHAGSVYLYILAEHQSSVDHYMPFRLLSYMVSIWSDHRKNYETKKLPLIIPLVFYNGEQKYDAPKDMRELVEAPQHLIDLFLFTPFHLIDTHDISDEGARAEHWTGLMEYVMKHIYEREAKNCLENLIILLKSVYQAGGSHYGTSALHYFLTQAKTLEPDQILDAVKRGLSEEEKIMATTAGEYWTERGIQQGIQRGECTLLMSQLEFKFKHIPESYRQRILKAQSESLIKWGRKILESESLEDVFSI